MSTRPGPSTSPTPLLCVRGLSVVIGARPVVGGVDLDLGPGERVALCGPSGSGKSLTAAAVLGRLPPGAVADGIVEIGATPVLRIPAALRPGSPRVAAIGQDSRTALNPLVRVGRQLRASVRSTGGDDSDGSLRALLADTGLEDPARVLAGHPGELSGGQRQRVQLAMALAGRPDLLVADEPTTALDPVSRRRVLDLLTERLAGTALLFISHDLAAARELCARIVRIRAGRTVAAGHRPDTGIPDRNEDGRGPTATRARSVAVELPRGPGADGPVRADTAATSRAADGAPAPAFLAARGLHRVHPDPRPRRPWSRAPRRPVHALRGADLAVHAGERVGLAGASGAGKSTLLRILLALERADDGTVTVDGHPVRPGPVRGLRWYRRAVQYVPQDPASALDPRASAGDLVAEPLARLAVPGDHAAAVATALDRVGLAGTVAGRRPGELSGGQAQRVALARALAVGPRLLIADEPLSGLDPELRSRIVELITGTCAEDGTGLLLVAHDLALLAALCPRAVVLHDGAVVEDRPTADLLAAPRHPAAAELVRASGAAPVRLPA
ncbi:ATP-binding cassette domain-containing protein [Pseudonocardia nematodicida]|uniref:ATP-binding cassette domain-containing protein n=1 Tax=Pseudonocardia nematodicida TaxID=1206997 RepID=A0ABV1KKE8_9PSEU